MSATKITKPTAPAVPHEHALRMLLMVAACFAIGSVGFFFAVLLQHSSTPAVAPLQATNDAKQKALESLAQSEAVTQSTTTTENATGSKDTISNVPVNQADTGDAKAAAKLKVLEGLNSQ